MEQHNRSSPRFSIQMCKQKRGVSSREGTHGANRGRRRGLPRRREVPLDSLVRVHSSHKDNTDQSDEQLTNKPLLERLSHLATHFLLPSSRYLLPSPKAEAVARQPAQHNRPGSPLSGPLWFQSKSESVCAHLCSKLMRLKKKKKKVAWIVSVSSEQTANDPFSFQGPPLDWSVNIVLHSLGICGGERERMREGGGDNRLRPICWKI